MSTIFVLKRAERGKGVSALRAAGRVPAVLYGPKDVPETISLSSSELDSFLKKEGESSVLTLEGDGIKKDVLIQDIQTHPVSGRIEHVDFYVIDRTKKVQVSVPLEFVGEAPAVKTLGGVLVKVLHELEIESLPQDIPQSIKVDVSGLADFESSIHAREIILGDGVTLVTNPEEIVVLAEAPREEEPEEKPADATTIADIERVGEKPAGDTNELSSKDEEDKK
jgi:large subunit ribosomal protein L25